MPSPVFRLDERIWLLPVVHGSGDYAVEVRRTMLEGGFDCLAVPLPENFRADVETAVERLPAVSVVLQRESREWTPERDAEEDGDEREGDDGRANFVPVDPCQPIIAAIRIALEERLPRAYIDRPTNAYRAASVVSPDPYALKRVPLERFATALLPTIPPPRSELHASRAQWMARRLRELARRRRSILALCSYADWPAIRSAWLDDGEKLAANDLPQYGDVPEELEGDDPAETELFAADPHTLLFLLGELPFVTALYERARRELDGDENLSIDGIKELLPATRARYKLATKGRGRKITPHLMTVFLKYARNLSLLERRFTPDLYTLAVAARQIFGDQFAIALTETVREYDVSGDERSGPPFNPAPAMSFGIGRGKLPDGTVLTLDNRLAGPPVSWRPLKLQTRPDRLDSIKWQMRWNPFRQCSWPPEDVAIESFRTHVKDRALAIIGADLARSEKFSTSLLDGLDIRETLRNWHTGDLYVKVLPPARGRLDCVVMLFDSPADPRDYPWRTTWMAEHHDESTLALFATDFHRELVGPGIGLATYGGAVFLFPPRDVPDIWTDRRLDFTTTLEERVLAAGCLHARERHIALLSDAPPGAGFRRMARRFGKKLVHVPLSHFSQETVQQLRYVHVLNGQEIRSYAAHFIRKA
jgi:hypothetical protein